MTAGDKIIFKAHSDDDMIISFFGKKEFYLSMEISKDIEREFIIKEDGGHYSNDHYILNVILTDN